MSDKSPMARPIVRKMARRKEESLAGLIRQIVKPGERLTGAEVGVASGALSEFLLREFASAGLMLYMVDLWKPFAEDSDYFKSGDKMARMTARDMDLMFLEVVHRTEEWAHRTVIHRCDTVEAAATILKYHGVGCLDFCFLDADHSEAGVRRDLAAWWPLVRPGGWFTGHDYGHRRYGGVKVAVDDFLAQVAGAAPVVLPGQVWAHRKEVAT